MSLLLLDLTVIRKERFVWTFFSSVSCHPNSDSGRKAASISRSDNPREGGEAERTRMLCSAPGRCLLSSDSPRRLWWRQDEPSEVFFRGKSGVITTKGSFGESGGIRPVLLDFCGLWTVAATYPQRDATCSSLLIFFNTKSTIFIPLENVQPHVKSSVCHFFPMRRRRACEGAACQTAWSNILIYRYFCGMCSAPVRMPSGGCRMPPDATSSPRPDHDVGAGVEGAQDWRRMRWQRREHQKGFFWVLCSFAK